MGKSALAYRWLTKVVHLMDLVRENSLVNLSAIGDRLRLTDAVSDIAAKPNKANLLSEACPNPRFLYRI